MCSLAWVHHFVFFLPLPTMAFSCSAASCQASPRLWYDYKQIRIYVIIFARGWFLWCCVFFLLICEDKQLWSSDGPEELCSIVLVMTLRGWVYSIGHTTAVEEERLFGSWYKVVHCLTGLLLFVFFPEVKTRLLLVLLQYTGLSHSPLAEIQNTEILNINAFCQT